MAVEAGKEELALLAVEAGRVETADTNPAQAPSGRFGKRVVALGAAVVLATAFASAAVVTAVRRHGTMQKAVQAGSRAQGLWANDGPRVEYVAAPASHANDIYVEPTHVHHVVHHVFPAAESAYHSGGNVVSVHRDSQDPGYSVHHVYVGSTPSYQDNKQFVTEVHHDALPAYHGDAYHGSHLPETYHQDTYHTVHIVHHQDSYPEYRGRVVTYSNVHTLALQHGAGLWWVVFTVVLVMLCCFGLYYYCSGK